MRSPLPKSQNFYILIPDAAGPQGLTLVESPVHVDRGPAVIIEIIGPGLRIARGCDF
jgi:hypothetical protein